MKKNLYNSNDEDHQHVINLLKELPREKAPDNFEYNLKVKIENKNFDLNTEKSNKFPVWKVLIPATGTAAAAILIFMISFGEPENLENPFQIEPQPRAVTNNTGFEKISEGVNEKKTGIVSDNDVLITTEAEDVYRSESRQADRTDVLISEPNVKPDFPFNNESSTNLDELRNQRSKSTIGSSASLAGRSNSRSFFNGFYIREEVDKEYVDKLKARIDSLKKAERIKKKEIKNVK
ncbi:MAG: hypothetical protein R3250_02495 [Melioribacteraceae bacterium]|nr:hypothetical protein [Melioribacteraceae bacterium]